MPELQLIVITGHPGSGKTTLARQLSRRYHLSFISKDAIKEHIFDALGTRDKAWSLKVSAAAHRIMDDSIEQALSAGGSIIVESNFKPAIDSQRFTGLARRHHAQCLQILCKANGDVLFTRWNNRIEKGIRHEGHAEAISSQQIKSDLSHPYPPLQLPGRLIEVDTTDTSKVDILSFDGIIN